MQPIVKPSYVLALDRKGAWACLALGSDADAALDAYERILAAPDGRQYAELIIRGKITRRKKFTAG